MSDIHDKIRSILEARLSSITGIPDIAWENVKYSPTTGQSFVQPTFVPTSKRPSVRGTSPIMLYRGFFSVNCFIPDGSGPGAADALAELILDSFEATTDLTDGTNYVTIEASERQQGVLRSPWYVTTVDIDWYSYK